MDVSQLRAVRRVLTVLLAVITVGAALSVVTANDVSAAVAVDSRLSQRDRGLTGRVWVKGQGCSRHHCVKGSAMYKEGYDAELCKVRGKGGWFYGQPISKRRCEDLGRVWIDEINICASNPHRFSKVVSHAPQCRNRSA